MLRDELQRLEKESRGSGETSRSIDRSSTATLGWRAASLAAHTFCTLLTL